MTVWRSRECVYWAQWGPLGWWGAWESDSVRYGDMTMWCFGIAAVVRVQRAAWEGR